MTNPAQNVRAEYVAFLQNKVRKADEDIKNGRIHTLNDVKQRVVEAAFKGAENAKRVA